MTDNSTIKTVAVGFAAATIAWLSQVFLNVLGDLYYQSYLESTTYYFFKSTNLLVTIVAGLVVAGLFYLYIIFISESLLSIGKKNTDLSLDKRKAKYHIPPKQYLSNTPQYLTVGTFGDWKYKKYVNIPFYQSPNMMLVFGAPGSAKTQTILNLLISNFNYQHKENRNYVSKFNSVFAIDIKPELTKKSVDEDLPDIKIVKCSSMNSKYGVDVFYGLNQDSSDDQLKTRCQLIAKCCVPSLKGDNEYFSTSAQQLMIAFMMHSFRHGLGFAEAMVKIKAVRVEDFIAEILADPEMKKHPKIVNLVKQFDGDSSDSFKSIQTTLIKDISIFDTDVVRYCFDGNPNKVTPKDLLEGNSVFVQIPDHLLQDYKIVLSVIIEVFARYILSQREEDLVNRNPILFLIDEAGVVRVPNITNYLATGRSKKIQIILLCQSKTQLEHLYGKDNAKTIEDCCKTQIIFSAYDVSEAKQYAEKCGQYRETKISTKVGRGIASFTSDGKNVSEDYRNCIDVNDIQTLENNNEVLVFDCGIWFICKKAPSYTIEEYRIISEKLVAKNAKNYRIEVNE